MGCERKQDVREEEASYDVSTTKPLAISWEDRELALLVSLPVWFACASHSL